MLFGFAVAPFLGGGYRMGLDVHQADSRNINDLT
jgi:hypothetical protein